MRHDQPGPSGMQHRTENIDSDMSNGNVSDVSSDRDFTVDSNDGSLPGDSIFSGDSGDDSDSDPNPDPNPDPDSDYDPSEDERDLSPQRKQPIPDELLKQISETKGSYRLCEDLVKIGVQVYGADPNQFSLSKTTIWKQITDLRSRQKNQLLTSLSASGKKIIIQFDGKSYKRLNERHVGAQERIIVLCHTEKNDIPLGLFPVESHSGVDCATEILKAIDVNNLNDQVVGVACDTENVNTGRSFGVCKYMENEMKKKLLHLMCRHHVFEVVLKSVFESIFGKPSGPSVTTFDILKVYWDDIKTSGFAFASIDHEKLQGQTMKTFADEALNTITDHSKHLRNDYAELNDLGLKFLGVATGNTFKVPGATTNARWMCRAIYALKLYLFRDHVELRTEFVASLERFCLFISLLYLKYWNQSSNTTDAPFNDLQFLKELDLYARIDKPVSDVAIKSFTRHLWYLSDELILLSLFSNKVSAREKMNMCEVIEYQVGDRTQNSIKYSDEIENIQEMELHQFISKRSLFLLHQLHIDITFVADDPADWNESETYRAAQRKIHDLIVVVNDSAERAIHLGINLIDGQRVQTEARLQDFIVSAYAKYVNKMEHSPNKKKHHSNSFCVSNISDHSMALKITL